MEFRFRYLYIQFFKIIWRFTIYRKKRVISIWKKKSVSPWDTPFIILHKGLTIWKHGPRVGILKHFKNLQNWINSLSNEIMGRAHILIVNHSVKHRYPYSCVILSICIHVQNTFFQYQLPVCIMIFIILINNNIIIINYAVHGYVYLDKLMIHSIIIIDVYAVHCEKISSWISFRWTNVQCGRVCANTPKMNPCFAKCIGHRDVSADASKTGAGRVTLFVVSKSDVINMSGDHLHISW